MCVLTLALSPKEYGDANAWFHHDVSASDTDPATRAILAASFLEHDVDKHAGSLASVPIYARVGESLNCVRVTQAHKHTTSIRT